MIRLFKFMGKIIKILIFIFLSFYISAFIYSNTILKHQILSSIKLLTNNNIQVGYLSSDFYSYISFKNVLFKPTDSSIKNNENDCINLSEMYLNDITFNLKRSFFNLYSNKSYSIIVDNLKTNLLFDGKNLYLPACLNLNNYGITNKNLLLLIDTISIKNSILTIKNKTKILDLNILDVKLKNIDEANLKFNIFVQFNLETNFLKLNNIILSGTISLHDLTLDGKLIFNESSVMYDNTNDNNKLALKFNSKLKGQYEFITKINNFENLINGLIKSIEVEVIQGNSLLLAKDFKNEVNITGLNGILSLTPNTFDLAFKEFSGRIFNSKFLFNGILNQNNKILNYKFSSNELIVPICLDKNETNEIVFNCEVTSSIDLTKNISNLEFILKNIKFLDIKRKILSEFQLITGEVLVNFSGNQITSNMNLSGSLNEHGGNFSLNVDYIDSKIKGELSANHFNLFEFKEIFKNIGININKKYDIKKANILFEYDNLNLVSLNGFIELNKLPLFSKLFLVESIKFDYKKPNIILNEVKFYSPLSSRANILTGTYNLIENTYNLKTNNFLGDITLLNIKGLEGLFAFNLNCEGKLSNFKINFDSNIKQIKYLNKLLGFSKIKGTLKSDGNIIHLSDVSLDDIMIKNGKVNKDYDYELFINLYEISIEKFNKLLSLISDYEINQSKLKGYITGDLHLNGNLYELNNSSINAEISELNAKYENIEFKNVSNIKIQNSKSVLEINDFNILVGNQIAEIQGHINLMKSCEVMLNVKLNDINLKTLKLYFNNQIENIEGKCSLNGKISGIIGKLKFDGKLQLDAKNIKLKNSIDLISELLLDVEAKNYEIKILKGKLVHLNNIWDISGKSFIYLKNSPLFLDLILECKNFKLNFNKDNIIEGNSRLGLKGEITKPRLYGSFNILKSKINLNDINFQKKKEPLKVEPLEIDIILFADKNVWFSNEFINIETKGKLNLKTLNNNLVYSGNITTVRGSIRFNRHEFQIENGKLQFNDSSYFEPILDINAYTNIDIFKIMLKLSGNISKPNFSLSSKPPLTQTEITALLTTGNVKNDLNSKDAASTSAKIYADYQKEKVLGKLKEKLKSKLDLDELSIKVNETNEKNNKNNSSVSVGKYVNDKLFINYTQSHEQKSDEKVKSYKFNYKLNSNTDLDIKDSNSEGSEIGIKVKRNF